MRPLTRAQQKAIVEQWKRAAPALQRARDEELRESCYDETSVDALLDIGANSPFMERDTNGLVEIQKWFLRAARIQGLMPAAVREEAVSYGGVSVPLAKRQAKGHGARR